MKLRDEGYMTSRWWMENEWSFGLQGDRATACRDSGEVKFAVHVMDDGGLRVAPHGRLTILNSGERDPDWRHGAEMKYGVLCRPANELIGQLFCPHTKKAIPASRFAENYVMWVDKEFGVAVLSGHVKYEVPDGPPIPREGVNGRNKPTIKYSFANRKRYKTERERVENLIAEAKLRVSLGEAAKMNIQKLQLFECLLKHPDVTDMNSLVRTYSGINEDHEKWLTNMCILSSALSQTALTDWAGKPGLPRYDDLLKESSADHYESDYVEWRAKP